LLVIAWSIFAHQEFLEGYGKVEKPKCAFQLSHGPGCYCWILSFEDRQNAGLDQEDPSGAKAPICLVQFAAVGDESPTCQL
jgi:hypothetical protein